MSEEPVISITKPEKQLIEKNNLEIEINNYDNSHLYYKGFDLGAFKEIANLRQENQFLKEELECTIGIVEHNRIITRKNKEIHQLKVNWNKLKEYAKEIILTDNELYGTDLLNKMQELEKGDSNE